MDGLSQVIDQVKTFVIWAIIIVVAVIALIIIYRFTRMIIFLVSYWRAKYLLWKQLRKPHVSLKQSYHAGKNKAYTESQSGPKNINAQEVNTNNNRFPTRKF